jgi:peptidoglycan/xylan/chitin deacetylase (PgdA/CDA1 family)
VRPVRPMESPRFPQPNLAVVLHVVPSVEWFRTLLGTIGRIYKFVPVQAVDEYLRGGRNLRNAAVVTFDDGDRTVYEYALPVLREMGIPAALFVSPKVIGEGINYWFQDCELLIEAGGERLLRDAAACHVALSSSQAAEFGTFTLLKSLTLRQILQVVGDVSSALPSGWRVPCNVGPSQLLELADSGVFTIGAHTLEHPVLTNETQEIMTREITCSRTDLQRLLERDVHYFAYPNGQPTVDFGDREITVLEEAGIRLAFSTRQGGFGRGTHPLAIPRMGIAGTRRETPGWILLKILATQLQAVRMAQETRQRRALRRITAAPERQNGPKLLDLRAG